MTITELEEEAAMMPVEPDGFQVRGWKKSPGVFENAVPGHSMRSWRITDCEIREVISFAEQITAQFEAVAVYAEITDSAGSPLLIRLAGEDPTEGAPFVLRATKQG